MFNNPIVVKHRDSVLHLVWTYTINKLDLPLFVQLVYEVEKSACTGSHVCQMHSSHCLIEMSATEIIIILGANVWWGTHPICRSSLHSTWQSIQNAVIPSQLSALYPSFKWWRDSLNSQDYRSSSAQSDTGHDFKSTIHDPCLYSG